VVALGFATGSLDTSTEDVVALAVGAFLFIGLLAHTRRSRR
jgi:hypothetical protein